MTDLVWKMSVWYSDDMMDGNNTWKWKYFRQIEFI